MLRTLFLAALLTAGPALASPNISVTLLPANLTGQPGETVGWSFSIEMPDNLSGFYAFFSSIEFFSNTSIGIVNQFLPSGITIGTPSTPSFEHSHNPYVYYYAPGANPTTLTYTINAIARPGDTVEGNLRFSFLQYYVSTEYYGPTLNFIGQETVDVATSITVPFSGQDIPEASTITLVAAGLASVLAFRKRKS